MAPSLDGLPKEERRIVTGLALFEGGAHPAELSRCIAGDDGTIEATLDELHRNAWNVQDVTARRILHRVAPWAMAVTHA